MNREIQVGDKAVLNGQEFVIIDINFPYIQVQNNQQTETIEVTDLGLVVVGKEKVPYIFNFIPKVPIDIVQGLDIIKTPVKDLVIKFIQRYWIHESHNPTQHEYRIISRKFKGLPYLVVEYKGLPPLNKWEYKVARIDPQTLDVYAPTGNKAISNLYRDDYIFFNGGVRNINDPLFKNKYPNYISEQNEKWSEYGLEIYLYY